MTQSQAANIASRKISFGQYYNSQSVIHNIDPRAKINIFLLFVITLFFVDKIISIMVLFALFIAICVASKVPAKHLIKAIFPMCLFCLFPLIFNLFLQTGEPIVTVGLITITDEGLYRSIYFTLRILLILLCAAELLLTTSTMEFCDACEYMLRPFSKIGVPSQDIAMILSIAMRFVPLLSDEYYAIKLSLLARGAKLDCGKLIERAKSVSIILLPLFIGAFRRAEILAIAMESRCYGINDQPKRTHYRKLKAKKSDFIAVALFIALLIIAIIWL